MEKTDKLPSSVIRIRMGSNDAHYGGNLVDGAKMLQLFGDVATELCIRLDGDEGLFRAYKKVEFLAPVYAGDFIEAKGRYTAIGDTSRVIEFEAWKVIRTNPEVSDSAAELLQKPLLVCSAEGVVVVPKINQRKRN